MSQTYLVRLNPQNKKKGNLLGNKTFLTPHGTLRFKNGKWYSVDEKYLPMIKDVTQKPDDPESNPAFTVVKTKKEALEVERKEKEAEERRKMRAFNKRSFSGVEMDKDFHEVDLKAPEPEPASGGDVTTEDLAAGLSKVEKAETTEYTKAELEKTGFFELKKIAKDLDVNADKSWKTADYVDAILDAQ